MSNQEQEEKRLTFERVVRSAHQQVQRALQDLGQTEEEVISAASQYEVELANEIREIRDAVLELGETVSRAELLDLLDGFASLPAAAPYSLVDELNRLSRSEQLDIVKHIFPRGWRLSLGRYVERIEASNRLDDCMRALLDVFDRKGGEPTPVAQAAAIAAARVALKSWADVGTGALPSQPVLDACKMCNGTKDGVPGNENVIGGVVMCDYCTAIVLDVMKAESEAVRLIDLCPHCGKALHFGGCETDVVAELKLYEPAPGECICWKCLDGKNVAMMVLCPTCGNKRCPKASDHDLTCTGSNEPGQPGSVYAIQDEADGG